MARKLKSDQMLVLATLVLVCLSVVMVYSASAVVAMDRYQQPYLFLTKQLMWATLGLALMCVVMRIDYRFYREPAFIWSCLGLVTVCLIAVMFSPPVNNAKRWFSVGGLGIQPSELAKLAAIFFIADQLERRMHRINELGYGLTPIALVVGGLVGLILIEPDFGTAMMLALIAAVMVFTAGVSYKYVAVTIVTGIPLVIAVAMSAEYRRVRIFSFWDPWADPLGAGFQVIQSMIAIGTGGVSGLGLMNGVQKLFYLPEPHTDFIFSVISEELGLIGATLVLVCFCVIVWRGFRAALRAPEGFGAFLAVGVTTMIAVQGFVNMGVALSLLPTKGIPLPFVSAGGSSLLIHLLSMGVLLNVSQHASTEA